MPVRNRPETPKTPRPRATRSTASTTATTEASSAPKGDLFVKDQTLLLPDDAKKPSHETQLERAERFLQVLRTKSDGKLTFGGKLTLGGIDREASMRSYYPSLRVAKALAEEPALAPGVRAFVDDDLGVPTDLRGVARQAAGADGVGPEATGPLGNRVFTNNNDWQAVYQSMSSTGAAIAPELFGLDDASCRNLLQTFYGSNFDASWFARAKPEDKIRFLRVFARAKETGGVINNVTAPTLNVILQGVSAAAPDALSVLHRLVAAFALDPKTVSLDGKTLDQYKGGGVLPSAGTPVPQPRQEPSEGALPSSPVGTASKTSAQLQKLIDARDPAAFAVNDAGVELIALKQSSFWNLASTVGAVDDPKWNAAFMRAWDRAAVLGVDGYANYAYNFVQSYIAGQEKSAKDPDCLAAVARLLKRQGNTEQQAAQVLGATPELSAAFDNVDRIAFGALAPVPMHRAPPGDQPGPLSNSALDQNGFNQYWSARDPRLFTECNDTILKGQYLASAYNPDTWHNQVQQPGAVSICARIIELGNAQTATQCSNWLRNVPQQYTGDAYIAPLVRLARACGVDLKDVTLNTATGPMKLADHKKLPRAPTPGASNKALAGAMSALDPKTDNSVDDKIKALATLVKNDPTKGVELNEVMAAAKEAVLAGKLEPINFTRLTKAQKDAALDAVMADGHLGEAAVLTGLFLKGADSALDKRLVAAGFDATQAKEWSGHAAQLGALDPLARALALDGLTAAQPDFLLLPLRLELFSLPKLTPAKLKKLFDDNLALDPSGVARALVDRAALGKGADAKAVGALLRTALADGQLTPDDMRVALAGGRHVVLMADVDAAVDAAVQKVITGTQKTAPAAVDKLKTVLAEQAGVVDAATLAQSALGKLYQSDLARVMPLDLADKELGGVAAKPWKEDNGKETKKLGKTVVVAGFEIQANEDPKKDVRAVPREDAAAMVMTETTERNLRLIAAEWRRGRPVLLEGPTSAGKTSAVRYLAHVTGSPYRRINLSYHTDVSDLIGRYVGGENRFSKADLEKKTAEELEELANDYGLDEGLSKTEQVAQLFEAQANPRWVDGPIVKAMRKGEVLLLDEVNLARPEVIERLNSLFDDDGNLVLTEHRNEVVERSKNFRIFATMNPASYAGRARLSEAMRSRWTSLYTQGLTQADLTQILKVKFGDSIPQGELAKLIAAHDALARAADDGTIGRASGGVAFSLRNLFRVCERFERYQGTGLSDDALMRRETDEIYRGGLFDPEDIEAVEDILTTAMPYSGPGFYDNLDIEETKDTLTIGDVVVRKLNTGHTFVPKDSSRLVMTQRTKEILYRLAKALDCGENVALIGERASGKTAIAKMYAHLVGQPYYRQLISASTDTMQLVGGYDDRGWKDGLLLDAARPENVPGMLLLDELNLGSSALLERLNPVLDDERKIVLAEKEGEEIKLHPDFRFIGAMNPPTKGYGGRQKLSKAMQNRLTQIYVPDLSSKDEQLEIIRAIAAKRGVPEPVADALVELHQWAVTSYTDGTLGKDLRELDRPVLSIRQLLNALDMVVEFQEERGAGDAFLIAIEAYYASSSELADCAAIMAKAKEVAS